MSDIPSENLELSWKKLRKGPQLEVSINDVGDLFFVEFSSSGHVTTFILHEDEMHDLILTLKEALRIDKAAKKKAVKAEKSAMKRSP